MRSRRLRSYAIPAMARVVMPEADMLAIDADGGTYVLAGQDVTFIRSRIMQAAAGAYAIGGQAVTLVKGIAMPADAGAYVLSGQAASFLRNRIMSGDAGAYTVSGKDAALVRSRIMTADVGTYSVAGQDATLTYTPVSGLTSISFITSTTNTDTTITMPTVQTGDFVYFIDSPLQTNSGSTQATPVTPSGFTPLVLFPVTGDQGGATTNTIYAWAFGRIVTNGATESGSTVTGAAIGTMANRRKMLMVFRGNVAFTSFSVVGASKVWDANAPAATSTDLTLGVAPFISFGNYRGVAALSGLVASPAFDANIDNGTLARSSYKIYNSAGSGTLSIDMNDSGSANVMTSFIVNMA